MQKLINTWYKSKSQEGGQIPARKGRGLTSPHLQLRELVTVIDTKVGRIRFFKGCGPWQVNHAPVKGHTSMSILATKIELSELL